LNVFEFAKIGFVSTEIVLAVAPRASAPINFRLELLLIVFIVLIFMI